MQLVSHQTKTAIGHNYYNGTKESEKPTLRTLLKTTKSFTQKITLDALHLCPKTTSLIEENKGIYIIGLKNNQKIIKKYCIMKWFNYPSVISLIIS